MTVQEFREGLDRYMKRCEPGSFMRAVLENDLLEAVSRADITSGYNLAEFVRVAYQILPGFMWGSPERVRDWLRGNVDANGNRIV